MTDSCDRGVIYIATISPHHFTRRGERLYESALKSIDSLQKVSTLPVTLVTNVPSASARTDINVIQIETTITEKDYTKDKVLSPYELTPYKSTLFLDADTRVLEDPDSLFNTRYDLCAGYEPNCNYDRKVWKGYYNHTYTTSIFLFNKTPVLDLFFKRKFEKYLELEKDPNRAIDKKYCKQPENWRYLSDQYAFNRTMEKQKSRLGIVVEPIHPRWMATHPVVRFIDNPAIIHSHTDPAHELKFREEVAEWTIRDEGIVDDLCYWGRNERQYK